jgi:hypothetical protein
MIYLRFTLLIMQNANNNGVKVELSGIPKSNLALLGLDKFIFLSLNMGNPPLAIFNSALLVTFLLILGNNFYNNTEFEGFKTLTLRGLPKTRRKGLPGFRIISVPMLANRPPASRRAGVKLQR